MTYLGPPGQGLSAPHPALLAHQSYPVTGPGHMLPAMGLTGAQHQGGVNAAGGSRAGEGREGSVGAGGAGGDLPAGAHPSKAVRDRPLPVSVQSAAGRIKPTGGDMGTRVDRCAVASTHSFTVSATAEPSKTTEPCT